MVKAAASTSPSSSPARVRQHPFAPDLVRQLLGERQCRHEDRAVQGEGEDHGARVRDAGEREHHELALADLLHQLVVGHVAREGGDARIGFGRRSDLLGQRVIGGEPDEVEGGRRIG